MRFIKVETDIASSHDITLFITLDSMTYFGMLQFNLFFHILTSFIILNREKNKRGGLPC